MGRSERPERNGSAGFTLVEALAALAIPMAELAAVGALAHTRLRSTVEAEQQKRHGVGAFGLAGERKFSEQIVED